MGRSLLQCSLRVEVVALAATLLTISTVDAGPRVIEESQRSRLPPPSPASTIAIDGDRLVAGSFVFTPFNPLTRQLDLYERNANGDWVFVQRLLDVPGPDQAPPIQVALQGDVAVAAILDAVHIVERTDAGWVHTALSKPSAIGVMGGGVAVDGHTIVVGAATGRYQAVIFRKSAAGQWAHIGHVTGGVAPPHAVGGDVDISGSTIALASPFSDPVTNVASGSAFLFTETNGVWTQAAELRHPLSGDPSRPFGVAVAIEGDTVILEDLGMHVGAQDMHMFRRAAGAWTYASSVRNPSLLRQGRSAVISGDLVAQEVDGGFGDGWIYVYRRSATELQPVARLRLSEPLSFPPALVSVSGRTITAAVGLLSRPDIVRFELPADLAQPAIVQDNFQDGNANGWSAAPVSAWSIATSGGSRIYRQTSFVLGSRSAFTNAAWTNQATEADVTPTAVQGADRWVGVGARFVDENNYYYLSLRSTNTVQLRRKVNGAIVRLAEAPFVFQLNRRYRLRIEAIGSRLRAFVNGTMVLEAVDRSLAAGRPALLTWGARSDFDNVVVTPNPLDRLYLDDFSDDSTFPWVKEFGTWVDPPPSVDPEEQDPYAHLRNFAQTSTSGKGRAWLGASTDNMVVRASARAISPIGGWFGVMARHRDDGNFYYLRLAPGSVAIRKYVNGVFFELARAPFTVNADVVYQLRFEVVGTSLRGYVNNRFLVEATDASHAVGRYGLGTNLTAARFDDVSVQQP